MKKRIVKLSGLVAILLAVFISALFVADYIVSNSNAQAIVAQFGYLGILVISIISGLNLFVPIPAPVFVPIFTAAGYPLWSIIVVMVIGTTIADTIGYLIGHAGSAYTEKNHPKIYAFLKQLTVRYRTLMYPFVFLYAALAPLPNELIMIPLAVLGFQYKRLIVPFVLGTIVYITALAYGAQNIFELFF